MKTINKIIVSLWLMALGVSGLFATNSISISALDKACNLNDSYSCNVLAGYYMKQKETKKAKDYALKSCDLNDGFGYFILSGIEVQNSNHNDAIKYIAKACDLGEIQGCISFTSIYAGDTFIKVRKKISNDMFLKYIEKACILNDGTSCAILSDIYIKGEIVAENNQKALKLAKKSADLQNKFGYTLLSNISFSNKKFSESYIYAQKACELGSIQSCFELIKMSSDNRFLNVKNKLSKEKLLEPFKKSCEQNSLYCDYLSLIYTEGDIVKKDYKKALLYAEKGCQSNNARSCRLVAQINDFKR
jgi:TPR repeat protein